MAIMEVRLVQQYDGQLCIMGWNYLSSGTPATVTRSFALADAMGFAPSTTTLPTGTIGEALQNVQTEDVSFISASVRDVYSNVDFYESPFLAGTTGSQTGGATLAPFTAYALTSSKSRNDIRRGQKRVVGVGEAFVGNFGSVSSTLLSGALGTLATLMGSTLQYDDEGNTVSFEPIIVKKERYQVPDSNPPRFAYRYWKDDEARQLQDIMTSIFWTAQPFVTTQSSRKRGRGR